jgi:hypothetical protein
MHFLLINSLANLLIGLVLHVPVAAADTLPDTALYFHLYPWGGRTLLLFLTTFLSVSFLSAKD